MNGANVKRIGVLCAVVGVLQAAPPNLEGNWMGVLEAGPIRLRLVLHLNRVADGRWAGTLDSPDQNAAGIPITTVTQTNDTVAIEIASIGASYRGTLRGEGSEIMGEFRQSGVAVPLTLRHNAETPVFRRPQEPKKPYPYDEQEVAFENRTAKIRLAGTLTLPRSGAPFPAVLLITGSGPQDRDESLAGHHPFLVLADFLTRQGIAVLRADDRGTGKSTGKFAESTTQDFVEDALAGVEYLKSRKEIDPGQIGLIGHSEGGTVAPMAAVRSRDVRFVVMMAGPGVTGEQILRAQGYLISRAMGMPEDMAAKVRDMNQAIYDIIKSEKDNPVAEKKIRERLSALRGSLPPDQQRALGGVAQHLDAQLRFATSPWFRAFLNYDPRNTLSLVKVPVLALNGELDLQVPPSQNLPAIVAALEAGRNPDYAVIKLPRLNHLFQTSETGSPAEYAKIEETIAPVALETVGQWVAHHTRTR